MYAFCVVYMYTYSCVHVYLNAYPCVYIHVHGGWRLTWVSSTVASLLLLYVGEYVGMVHTHKYGSASLYMQRPEKDIRYLPLLYLLSHDQ